MRFSYGFLLAAMIGVPLGLLMGWFRWLDDVVSPIFDMLRFIAPIAWVPFAALWFGTGIGGPIMIIFAGAFPPCLINAYRGARFVDPNLIEAAQMLGMSNARIIVDVLLPASIPSIVAGLRVSAGLGWQSLVGAELIVASAEVGYMMVQAQANVSTATVMSGMIAIGIVGILIDVALRRFEPPCGGGAAGVGRENNGCDRICFGRQGLPTRWEGLRHAPGRRAFDPRQGVRRHRRTVRLRQDDVLAHGGGF